MIRGLKVVCTNFHMFLGMVKETSKDKKWSKGSKESAEGQGKAIQVWFTWSGKISYNIRDGQYEKVKENYRMADTSDKLEQWAWHKRKEVALDIKGLITKYSIQNILIGSPYSFNSNQPKE